MSTTVTRFAPSPTGHLHIGGARTALFCWAYAKKTGGSFMIRVEDTDQARSSEASARGILSDLAWLGIDWDEGPEFQAAGGRLIGGDPRGVGPFFQSERLGNYDRYIEQLIGEGKAYPAFDTPEELEEKRKAALKEKRQYRYDRAALEIPEEERLARMKRGEPHVIRFKTPDDEVVVTDAVLGEVRIAPGEVDDFIIRKRDGYPTYHFGVVVDDELMGVTHVLRGQEHLNNTPRHVLLMKALGFRVPVFAHMPLIFNEAGAKMSKRERDKAAREAVKAAGLEKSPVGAVDQGEFEGWLKDKARQLEGDQLDALADALGMQLPEVSVEDFRKAGYLPEVICNFVALLGWSPADAGENIEKFDNAFLAQWFDIARIGKTNARFDRKKLLSFNGDAISAMSDEDFEARWGAWCAIYRPELTEKLTHAQVRTLSAALRPRSKTLLEAGDGAMFAILDDSAIPFDEKAVEKNLKKNDGEGLETLRAFREVCASIEPFDPPTIHSAVESFAKEREIGMGKIAQPLRVALTGTTISPPIDATLAALGRERTLKRIDLCLGVCG